MYCACVWWEQKEVYVSEFESYGFIQLNRILTVKLDGNFNLKFWTWIQIQTSQGNHIFIMGQTKIPNKKTPVLWGFEILIQATQLDCTLILILMSGYLYFFSLALSLLVSAVSSILFCHTSHIFVSKNTTSGHTTRHIAFKVDQWIRLWAILEVYFNSYLRTWGRTEAGKKKVEEGKDREYDISAELSPKWMFSMRCLQLFKEQQHLSGSFLSREWSKYAHMKKKIRFLILKLSLRNAKES